VQFLWDSSGISLPLNTVQFLWERL